MTTEAILTDAQIFDCFDRQSAEIVMNFDADELYPVGRAIEQAVLKSPEVQRLREDAELGDVAMRFVDRAGDHCKEDPAERICDEFHRAMADVVDRHGAMRGMPSGKYDSTGKLK